MSASRSASHDGCDEQLYDVVLRAVVVRHVRGPIGPCTRHVAVQTLRRALQRYRHEGTPVFHVEVAEVARIAPHVTVRGGGGA